MSAVEQKNPWSKLQYHAVIKIKKFMAPFKDSLLRQDCISMKIVLSYIYEFFKHYGMVSFNNEYATGFPVLQKRIGVTAV